MQSTVRPHDGSATALLAFAPVHIALPICCRIRCRIRHKSSQLTVEIERLKRDNASLRLKNIEVSTTLIRCFPILYSSID